MLEKENALLRNNIKKYQDFFREIKTDVREQRENSEQIMAELDHEMQLKEEEIAKGCEALEAKNTENLNSIKV